MPTIDLGDWENGLSFYSCFSLWALMTHPNNEKHRKEFIAKVAFGFNIKLKQDSVDELEAEINELVKSGELRKEDLETAQFEKEVEDYLFDMNINIDFTFKEIIDQAGGEEMVSDSPSFEDVVQRSCQNPLKPVIAGELLLRIMQLEEHFPGKGSLNRACHIIENQRGISNVTIMKAWKEFKSVSHLWAALIAIGWEEEDYDGWKNEEEKFFLKGLDPLDPEKLQDFLSVAEIFRKFGETHHPKNGRASTLDKNETWIIPTGFPLIQIPDWFKSPDITKDVMKIMDNFMAPIDNRRF